MGLLGILAGLGVLVWLSFRGWSVLVLAPLGALVAAAFAVEPLLAHWTLTFMGSAAGFRAVLPPVPARRDLRQAHGHGLHDVQQHVRRHHLHDGRRDHLCDVRGR